MNDPALDDAATKIQAGFKGYKARKEVQAMKVSECEDFLSFFSPISVLPYSFESEMFFILSFINVNFYYCFWLLQLIKSTSTPSCDCTNELLNN